MRRWLTGLISVLGLLAFAAGPAVAADDAYTSQKVVYHVNFGGDEDNWKYMATLRNIQNHINAVGKDKLDMRVVMNGNGLRMLQNATEDKDLAQRISNLKGQGVSFKVCANTMEGRDISLDDLYDAWEDDIVPSGVAEVAKLQQDGFALVKTY